MNNHISARWDLRGDCGEDSEANTHSGEEREKPQLFFILCFSFFFCLVLCCSLSFGNSAVDGTSCG